MLSTVVLNFTLFYSHLLCLTNFVGSCVIFGRTVNKTGNVLTNVILRLVCRTPFCSRKAYSDCVSFALIIQRAMCMRHIFICGLPGSTIFLHITSYTVQYSGKKYIEHKISFYFLYSFSEKFVILSRVQRDIIMNVHTTCKAHVICLIF